MVLPFGDLHSQSPVIHLVKKVQSTHPSLMQYKSLKVMYFLKSANIINNYNESVNTILDTGFFSSLTIKCPHIPSTPFWSTTHSGWTIRSNDPDSTDPDSTRRTSTFNGKVHFKVMRQSLLANQAQNHV